jgi:hypothetical protein
MSRKLIHEDVWGAPFNIGELVRIGEGTDETFDARYNRRLGTVEYFEYQCGCGQTYPSDPMIGIRFRDGAIEEFWAEELIRRNARFRSVHSRSTQPIVATTKKLHKTKIPKYL